MNINILDVTYGGDMEYERQIKFRLDNNNNVTMWAFMLSTKPIQNNTEFHNLSINTEATLSITFVDHVEQVLDDRSMVLIQKTRNSNIYCIGVIKKILSIDSFICEVVNIGEIFIDLNSPNTDIYEGMKVEFSGELEINITDELPILYD